MPKVLVPKETRAGETRVAATPETVKKLVKAGLEVAFEAGAGAAAGFADSFYVDSGAGLGASWESADVVHAVTARSRLSVWPSRRGLAAAPRRPLA